MNSPPSLAALLVTLALIAGSACTGELSLPDPEARPTPPSQAVDPLNAAIYVEAGAFVSGSDDFQGGVDRASPFSKADEAVHTWEVEAFWMQEHEVTHAEYARFDPTHAVPPGAARHPVTEVTFEEALAYAESLGGTLPTEVEWEYAARGAERRRYPWGEEPPSCGRTHYLACEPRGTVPVMSRPLDRTPEGIHDLAGNVREWTMPVWFVRGRHPVNHETRKLKGGSFDHPTFFLRAASVTNDMPDDYAWDNVGFRVVWEAVER